MVKNVNEEVRGYVEAVSDDRRRMFDELHALITGMYPNAEVAMSYRIPTYRSESGWVALGYRKDGVSLYTNGPSHIEGFKAKHPTVKTGKGSINFKLTDPIPVPDLKQVVRHAIEPPNPN